MLNNFTKTTVIYQLPLLCCPTLFFAPLMLNTAVQCNTENALGTLITTQYLTQFIYLPLEWIFCACTYANETVLARYKAAMLDCFAGCVRLRGN